MTYTEDQLTEWFDKDTKPTRIGVYEVSVYPPGHEDFDPAYSKWDGEKWNKYLSYKDCGCSPVDAAKELFKAWGGGRIDMYWRGLSQNPNAKPQKRSGNKRKVMYVVQEIANNGTLLRSLASFRDMKHAKSYAASVYCYTRIDKIRFRTPEQE